MKLIIILFVTYLGISSSLESLKVTLYYESLCPDCVNFITKQLYPGYERISPYLEWYFIPYGNAKRRHSNGKWSFTCQHGPKECISNKAHACALALARTVVDKMEYVNCVEDSGAPGDIESLRECCEGSNLEWSQVHTCLTNGTGDELLAKYGAITDNATPKIRFVPTIFFNDVYNETLQNGAVSDFLGTACNLLGYAPKGCASVVRKDIEIVLVD